MRNEPSPEDFLRSAEFSPKGASERFPNATWRLLGGLFISHSGGDSAQINSQIISPVVNKRFPGDGYFLHSASSVGRNHTNYSSKPRFTGAISS
jgi:hypothetical protein